LETSFIADLEALVLGLGDVAAARVLERAEVRLNSICCSSVIFWSWNTSTA
jgi:hypothetical protein